ncbi:DUF4189 domain-containing protein [Xanthomonas sp. 3498]|uniref:DUF4189 domain-containing protein n=1 Tax=Xanthomonas sp. 3498 TaxID=2663863 RepID=UPI00160E39C8|nr:DUF4189 domain-containing protein [Xanthomonas sp. 3498]MBB5875798.1 hypothetical protein [Xanthomonas sp. 3498]
MKLVFAISLFFLVVSGSGFAQTRCPGGVQAGSAQCLPDEDSSPARPTGEWIKTWGAIVMSDSGQEGWSSVGKFSKDDAVQDALEKCHAVGVTDCSVKMTYFNQCVAIANPSRGVGSDITAAKDEKVAGQLASEACNKRTGSQCFVKFTECTVPFFKKY